MTKDRLAQIWQGFSERSRLDLSGVRIEEGTAPLDRPSARQEQPSFQMPDAAGQRRRSVGAPDQRTKAPDPVAAALMALHADDGAPRRRGGRQRTPMAAAGDDVTVPPAPAVDARVFADLAATRNKTTRRPADYLTYAAARQEEWLAKRRRKKFLGLF
ncbi:hypothetical protein PB2503_08554 [Parvularcula bermudensis HTCC2503]|uniref:Uncharacterized protein n=1 Tax=Parvularcula bermudensis (strain ATCC BAA-594 / HTCC2503 / KCTC 12087) TaxID=314260 RepID=E0TBP5_PARBH|nr:hypothetical protein [Parvularcula bermudensis]ADM09766.1 hypothetical protein PB2503_08554 [Parvularcula bermudensis HTCC2503]